VNFVPSAETDKRVRSSCQDPHRVGARPRSSVRGRSRRIVGSRHVLNCFSSDRIARSSSREIPAIHRFTLRIESQAGAGREHGVVELDLPVSGSDPSDPLNVQLAEPDARPARSCRCRRELATHRRSSRSRAVASLAESGEVRRHPRGQSLPPGPSGRRIVRSRTLRSIIGSGFEMRSVYQCPF